MPLSNALLVLIAGLCNAQVAPAVSGPMLPRGVTGVPGATAATLAGMPAPAPALPTNELMQGRFAASKQLPCPAGSRLQGKVCVCPEGSSRTGAACAMGPK